MRRRIDEPRDMRDYLTNNEFLEQMSLLYPDELSRLRTVDPAIDEQLRARGIYFEPGNPRLSVFSRRAFLQNMDYNMIT